MIRLTRRVLVLCVVAGVAVAENAEKREFIPSASMDTEDGWRVIENPLQLGEVSAAGYLSFPKIERLSNEIASKSFLNNDEEFRIRVMDIEDETRAALFNPADSFPVASAYVAAAMQDGKKEPVSPLRMVEPPSKFRDEPIQKIPSFGPSDVLHQSSKYPRLFPDRYPRPYDMVPDMSTNNLHDYQHLLAAAPQPPHQMDDDDDEYEYIAVPKTAYRKLPMVDEAVKYYEVDKNARPIILGEEIRYEGHPPFMGPPRFPPMPMKMNFPPLPHGANMLQRPPFFKPLPPSVKVKRVVGKSSYSKRKLRSSKGIPLVRGRFRV